MEKETNLFGLNVDEIAAMQLREAAKWARVVAISCLVSLSLIIIYSLAVSLGLNNSIQRSNRNFDDPAYSTGYYVGTAVGVLIVALIYFFPCYYLLRFSNKMIAALRSGDNGILMESFRNLKITFRYIGVLTIIFLTLFAIGILINLAG